MISGLTGLEFYNCAKTGATSLDMSNQPNLMLLFCGYNGETLRSLNIRNNPRLADLRIDCDYNLPSLDLSGNPQLYYLQAFGLHITSLDISHNPSLIAAYTRGAVEDCSHLGKPIHSYTLEYGGSNEYFEDLTHCIVVDDECTVITAGGNPANASNCYINTNDGHGSEQFATRGEAIQLLYELAGSPSVGGSSRFNDVAGSPYANAIAWGAANNICFGYPGICSDSFCPNEMISREDFALMAHRFAGYMGFGTAFDYGRTDWFDDFYAIDYYGWGAFTWAIQFGVLNPVGNSCCPHGRVTTAELHAGANQIFHLDPAASYSSRVSANGLGNGGGAASTGASSGGSSSGGGGGSSSGGGAPAAAPAGGGSPAAAGGVEGFIDRLYRVVLERDPDPVGKAHWLELLNNGATGADIARGFFFSQEFLARSRQLTDEEFLEILYSTFFDRTPDAGGRAHWLNMMNNGMSRSTVYGGFINSVEWSNLCVRFGIPSGGTAPATTASN